MIRVRGAAAALALVMTTLAGCGSTQDGDDVDQRNAEQVADEARGYIDDLAAMLGPDRKVLQDTLSDCTPGQEDSGKSLVYNLQVDTEPGAKERLLGEVQEKWESRGWTAKTGGPVDLRLLKDSFSMGATLSSDGTRAAVGGSGGCVK